MRLQDTKSTQHYTARQLQKTYTELLETFKHFLKQFATLTEATLLPVEGDLEEQLAELTKRFEAAKRGLGLVNKLRVGPERRAQARRVMGNLNKIRAMLGNVVKAMDSFNRAQQQYDRQEDLDMPYAVGYEHEEKITPHRPEMSPVKLPAKYLSQVIDQLRKRAAAEDEEFSVCVECGCTPCECIDEECPACACNPCVC